MEYLLLEHQKVLVSVLTSSRESQGYQTNQRKGEKNNSNEQELGKVWLITRVIVMGSGLACEINLIRNDDHDDGGGGGGSDTFAV